MRGQNHPVNPGSNRVSPTLNTQIPPVFASNFQNFPMLSQESNVRVAVPGFMELWGDGRVRGHREPEVGVAEHRCLNSLTTAGRGLVTIAVSSTLLL